MADDLRPTKDDLNATSDLTGRQRNSKSDVLERIRKKRSGGQSSTDEENNASHSTRNDTRRRDLQKLRQQARNSEGSDQDNGDGSKDREMSGSATARRGELRQIARSPLRNSRANKSTRALITRPRRNTDSDNGDDNDDDSDEVIGADGGEAGKDDKEPDAAKSNDEEFELEDIVQTCEPVHTFPLAMLPTTRRYENAVQPLLVMPAPHPDLYPTALANALSYTQEIMQQQVMYCWGWSSPASRPASAGERSSELSLLTGKHRLVDSHLMHSAQSTEMTTQQVQLEKLLEESTDTNGQSISQKIDEMYAGCSQDDGMFVGTGPPLSQTLLTGEGAQASLKDLINPTLDLSRITQRVIRDVKAGAKTDKLRRQWRDILAEASKQGRLSRSKQPALSSISEGASILSSGGVQVEKNQRAHSALQLLLPLAVGPVLRVVPDPVDHSPCQPVIPAVTKAYGGELGSWSSLSSSQARLGTYIPSGYCQDAVKRSILRVHVHRLELSEHPLFNDEERMVLHLRETYNKYRVLLQEKKLAYLTHRLVTLNVELSRLLEVHAAMENNTLEHEEEDKSLLIDSLRRVHQDLVESLPLLCNLRALVDTLSASVYEGWRAVQDLRKKNSCCSTKVLLLARKVGKDAQLRASNAANIAVDEIHGDFEWHTLCGSLSALSSKLKMTHEALLDAHDNAGMLATFSNNINNTAADNLNASMNTMNMSLSKKMTATTTAIQDVQDAKALEHHKERQEHLKLQLDKILDISNEAISVLLLRKSMMPEYILKLSDDGAITPDSQVSADELGRRKSLANLRFRAVVAVAGVAEGATSTAMVHFDHTSLSIDFQQNFEFRVVHRPQEVSVLLYSSSQSMCCSVPATSCCNLNPSRGGRYARTGETFVAAVTVPVPGAAQGSGAARQTSRPLTVAHALGPTTGVYTFSSETVFVRDVTGGSLWSVFGPTPLEGLATRIQGKLSCSAEFDPSTAGEKLRSTGSGGVSGGSHSAVSGGLRSDQIACLPIFASARSTGPVSDSHVIASTTSALGPGSTGNGPVALFSSERDFQEILPSLSLLDLHDPTNDELVILKQNASVITDRDVFHLTGTGMAISFGEENCAYDNFVRFQLTSRLKLLMLRELKPFLFAEQPIPLSESSISSSELYKKLLSQHSPPVDLTSIAQLTLASQTGLLPDISPGTLAFGASLGAMLDEEDEEVDVGARDIAAKARINNFLDRVRNASSNLDRVKRRKALVTSAVVAETAYYQPPEPADLEKLFPERKRALRPVAAVRTALATQVDSCNLLVQVVGAKNIPLRCDEELAKPTRPAGARNRASSNARQSRAGGGASGSESEGEGDRGRADEGGEDAPMLNAEVLDEGKRREKMRAHTFVEVKFQENSCQTVCIDGATPLWKQSLSLPFRPPDDDFSPAKLAQVNDIVVFTLFDEVVEDDADKGGFLEGENTERRDRRYLGSFAVPFGTIYREGRIEGIFRMSTPAINFGYNHKLVAAGRKNDTANMFEGEAEAVDTTTVSYYWSNFFGFVSKPQPMTNSDLRDNGLFINKDSLNEFSYYASGDTTTFIKLMITLDPILASHPDTHPELVPSAVMVHDRPILHYAKSWVRELKSIGRHTADRDYKVFGVNSHGLNVLICRYLAPMQPPRGFNSRRACVHLTSLIPYIGDSQAFIGEMDLWCSVKETWDLGAGDEEEHAVMLYNYLSFLNQSSGQSDTQSLSLFVVLGKAIPEGNTVFVLMKDSRKSQSSNSKPFDPDSFLVLSPCTGHIYSAADPNCPLTAVYSLVTSTNIWANIQHNERPNKIQYDIQNVEMWRPLFGQRMVFPGGGASVQEEINYVDTPASYALEIEKAIRHSLKTKIRQWRSKRQRSITTFHPDACAIMNDILPKLDNWKQHGSGKDYSMSASVNNRPSGSGADSDATLTLLQEEVKEKMKAILRTRTLRGFPLNLPFTDVNDVVEQVKTLCVHEAKHPDVQFVMAVRVLPVVNNVVSVWVYLGTLEANQT